MNRPEPAWPAEPSWLADQRSTAAAALARADHAEMSDEHEHPTPDEPKLARFPAKRGRGRAGARHRKMTAMDVALVATGADRIYGTDDTRKRAAIWAGDRGYRLSGTHWRCAHGLLRLGRRFPCGCGGYRRLLDHANIWVRGGTPAVLLAHSYLDLAEVTEQANAYATEHRLVVVVGDPADGWYGAGTVPVRFERQERM